MKQVKASLLLLLFLISTFTSADIVDYLEDQMASQGIRIASPTGLKACLNKLCFGTQRLIDPKTGREYTEIIKGKLRYNFNDGVSFEHETIRRVPDGQTAVYVRNEYISAHMETARNKGYKVVKNEITKEGIKADVGAPTGEELNDSTLPVENPNQAPETRASSDGLATFATIAFAVFSSKASLSTGKNAALELAESIGEVENAIKKSHISSQQLNRFSSQLVKLGIHIPEEISRSVESNDVVDTPPMVELSSLTEYKEYLYDDQSDINDLSQQIDSQDIDSLLNNNEAIISAIASTHEIPDSLKEIVNESGVIDLQNMGLEGPLDSYQVKTDINNLYGRLVRRAANKIQLAYAKSMKEYGRNLMTARADFINSVPLLKIADTRLAAPKGLYSAKFIDQAEGILFAVEKVAEASSGLVDGAYSSLVNHADAIYMIPEMGEDLYNYAKYAFKNPVKAGEQSWEVLKKTPEFMSKFVGEFVNRMENFDQLSLYEQSKFIGEVASDVTIGVLGGGAVVKSVKIARKLKSSINLQGKLGKTTFAEKTQDIGQSVSKSQRTPGSNTGLHKRYLLSDKDMPPKYAKAFNGDIEIKTIKTNTIIYQGQNLDQYSMGRWLGDELPWNPIHAEELWNIKVYGKVANRVVGYRVKRDFQTFYGRVADGEGRQMFHPNRKILEDVLEPIFEIQY